MGQPYALEPTGIIQTPDPKPVLPLLFLPVETIEKSVAHALASPSAP